MHSTSSLSERLFLAPRLTSMTGASDARAHQFSSDLSSTGAGGEFEIGFQTVVLDSSVCLPAAKNFACAAVFALAVGAFLPLNGASAANPLSIESPSATNAKVALAPQANRDELLRELDSLDDGSSAIAQAYQDAREIAACLPQWLECPAVWTDNETEIVFEWQFGERHAAMSFEGDHHFAYAMLRDGIFVPGITQGSVVDGFPVDLAAYLHGATGLS